MEVINQKNVPLHRKTLMSSHQWNNWFTHL